MSILKGGASTDTYNFTLTENELWDWNDGGIDIGFRWIRTNKIIVQQNNIIFDNLDDEAMVILFDDNDNVIEVLVSQQAYDLESSFWDSQTYFNGNTIPHNQTLNVSSNVYSFAVNFTDTFNDNRFLPIVTLQDAQNNVYQYETSPAIDNIYYGGAIVENHLSFDGSNDYVLTNGTSNLQPSTFNTLEINLTIELASVGSSYIFSLDGRDNQFNATDNKTFFQVRTNSDNSIRIGHSDTSNNQYYVDTNTTLNVNQKYDIKIVHTFNTDTKIYFDGVLQSTTEIFSITDIDLSAMHTYLMGMTPSNTTYYDGNIYYFDINIDGSKKLEYLFDEGSGTTLNDSVGTNDGTINGATWGTPTVSYPTIDRVYAGSSLVYGQAPVFTYELIADVEVTSNTTQIDFDNLNITKDDELVLSTTTIATTTSNSLEYIYVNNNNNSNNYWRQSLSASGSTIYKGRENSSVLWVPRSNQIVSGFADIKISNNDRLVVSSRHMRDIGNPNNLQHNYANIVSTFTVSSINKISIVSSIGIAPNSRFTLYKVNKGSA